MLILTRQPGDAVTIGDDVMVTVMRTSLGSVRLGIICPKDRDITQRSEQESLAWRLGKQMEGGTWAALKRDRDQAPKFDGSMLAERRRLVIAGSTEGGAL